MAYDGLKDNKNAEKWTEDKATALFDEAIDLARTGEYDFIGEVATTLNTYIDLFDYLVEKFPQLQNRKKRLMRVCEANCFANGKKGKIVPSLAIMNLKSNHGWTDRQTVDQTTEATITWKEEKTYETKDEAND